MRLPAIMVYSVGLGLHWCMRTTAFQISHGSFVAIVPASGAATATARSCGFVGSTLVSTRSFAGSSWRNKRSIMKRQVPGMSTAQSKGPKKIKKRPALLRADRVLSNRGWGSRSECFNVLKQRRVKVWKNDEYMTLSGPSERLGMNDKILVDNKEVPSVPLLLKYFKPKWILSVMRDPQDRPNLGQILPMHYQKQSLHPVGRLDYDTSGLLLFSSNGALTQKLLHPTFHVEKEYVAVVEGVVEEEDLRLKLKDGVETTEGNHVADLLGVEILPDKEVDDLMKTLRANLPQEYNITDLEHRGYLSDVEEMSRIRMVVQEGKHRMVRRMLANCGHPVIELKRERHGILKLNDMVEGSFANLTDDEYAWAQSLIPTKGKKKGK